MAATLFLFAFLSKKGILIHLVKLNLTAILQESPSPAASLPGPDRPGKEPVQDQSVKKSSRGGMIQPAQVQAAYAAKGCLPGRIREPGKIRCGRPCPDAARGQGKTADDKDEAMGIGENMPVVPGHGDAPAFRGDRGPAGNTGKRWIFDRGRPGSGNDVVLGGIRLAGIGPDTAIPGQGGRKKRDSRYSGSAKKGHGGSGCRFTLRAARPYSGQCAVPARQPAGRQTRPCPLPMRVYLGHLSPSDPLQDYLRDAILPQLVAVRREPRWRIYRVSAQSDVYLYEDKWSEVRVVGKFYAHARGLNGSNAPQSAANEYRNLDSLRSLGFTGPPDGVVRPLGVNRLLGDLLVVEHMAGEQLDTVIEGAVRQGRGDRLYARLTGLARFLARLHNHTAGPERVDFGRTLAYFERVLAYLETQELVSQRRLARFREFGQDYAAFPELSQDVQVCVHGDATPSNFLFGRGQDVWAIDLERMHRDDRLYDVGRLCGELKHCLLRLTGDPWRSEPFIGHFLWEYAGHFPDRRRAFDAITARLPFYLGLTLLRIARNRWLDADYRRRLVQEARKIFKGGLA